ncbi:MAG TPA: hypothetical protein VK507_16660 [Iamia sp.]|nr:hypothetical protein [Iamia sp.]
MLRHRSLVAVLGVAAPVLLLAACSDEEASGPCADVVTAVVESVVYVPPDAPFDEEEIDRYRDMEAAVARLVDDPPPEVADDVAVVAEGYEDRAEEPEDDVLVAIEEASDRLIAWAATTCEPDGPIWRCSNRSTFHAVDELDAPDDTDTARVTVEEGDDQALFAWLDDDGLAVRAETAVPDGDGWQADERSSCF